MEAVKKISASIISIIEDTPEPENHDLLALLQMNIGTYINGNNDIKTDIVLNRRKYEKVKEKFIKRRGRFNIFQEAVRVFLLPE